ncbi:MAG: hypothetical protein BWK77_08035 [Verrucomicrobia bacterium A1]|nr:MAG: hypothetical protein BWK77_08035 [Verrucomicrobia bacterium A1]
MVDADLRAASGRRPRPRFQRGKPEVHPASGGVAVHLAYTSRGPEMVRKGAGPVGSAAFPRQAFAKNQNLYGTPAGRLLHFSCANTFTAEAACVVSRFYRIETR